MIAAHCVFTIFFHKHHAIFKGESVENHQKPRRSTTNAVDNYVDVVDRTVNIHQKAKNIYTSYFFSLVLPAAWQKRRNCKLRVQFRAFLRDRPQRVVTAFTRPTRNKYARLSHGKLPHVIVPPPCLKQRIKKRPQKRAQLREGTKKARLRGHVEHDITSARMDPSAPRLLGQQLLLVPVRPLLRDTPQAAGSPVFVLPRQACASYAPAGRAACRCRRRPP